MSEIGVKIGVDTAGLHDKEEMGVASGRRR